MIFCNSCILPNTRPNLIIDKNGLCNACNQFNLKTNINWNARKKELLKIVNDAKKNSSGYDCLIPVSGGKDSTWQVIKLKEFGLSPLTFTYKPLLRNKIGLSILIFLFLIFV